MKTLSKIILAGVLSFSPMTSYSPQVLRPYIPLENKLREIEKTSQGIPSNICMYKAMRYYINAKAAGEDANVIIGWLTGSDVWHAWVGIKKGDCVYYVDPAWNLPEIKDGFPKAFYTDREEIYVFKSDLSIEDFVNRKEVKRKNRKTIKKFRQTIKNPKKEKINQRELLIKGIEDYCKQDTLAWDYYLNNIKNNSD